MRFRLTVTFFLLASQLFGAAVHECIKSMSNLICEMGRCRPRADNLKRDRIELDQFISFLNSHPAAQLESSYGYGTSLDPLSISRGRMDEPQFFEDAYSNRLSKELEYTRSYFASSPRHGLAATTTIRGRQAIETFKSRFRQLTQEIVDAKDPRDDSIPMVNKQQYGQTSSYLNRGCFGIVCATASGVAVNIFRNEFVFGSGELKVAAAALAITGWISIMSSQKVTDSAPYTFLRDLPKGAQRSAFFSMPVRMKTDGDQQSYTLEMLYYAGPVLGGYEPRVIISIRPFEGWQE